MMPERFPDRDLTGEPTNPAIQLYGRRFYKDQTPVEYLAEFLLVFASPKGESDAETYACTFSLGNAGGRATYRPDDGMALKLFAFFPASKLETRHAVHQEAYLEALTHLDSRIEGTAEEREEAIRLLQSLLSGFVGVAKNRTWATYTFLPAARALLSRELDWLHSRANRDEGLSDWDGAKRYFATDRHNFMARGGELLFLQLAHLFDVGQSPFQAGLQESPYSHLCEESLPALCTETEQALKGILEGAAGTLSQVTRFVNRSLSDFGLKDKPPATLGWIPKATIPESHLFAFELRNLACSAVADLEKVDLIQLLCCMQVLRTLCFQSNRNDSDSVEVRGFTGNYTWITAAPDARPRSAIRKVAEVSLERIEEVLFRVLRKQNQVQGSMTEADRHGFQIFRKIGKEIGLIIPRAGKGQRFVLPPHLLRFLVTALLRPGEHMRLDHFYERVFAHYGIALGERQLAATLAALDDKDTGRNYAVSADTSWIEEALRQGGFLVELSDAVSIVHSPGSRPGGG